MINAYQQYQQNSILLASPQKLLIMLYDGAIRFI
ncbi:MAG: Flagellar protein FliS, partial [Clostridiales bacterium]|nr:Flagellar protein FliS [Clostridiales bacterium]